MNKKKIESTTESTTDGFMFEFSDTFERYSTNRYNLSKVPVPMQDIYRAILRENDKTYIMDNMLEYISRLNNEK